jgi:hypothetical protein
MAVIKLTIYVPNLSNVIGLFNKIDVHRSSEGESGPYFSITTLSATPATLAGSVIGPFNINGKTLKLKINNGSEQTITFNVVDPISADDVADEINAFDLDIVASEVTNKVSISTVDTGTISKLEITGGTALSDLGFTLDDWITGTDAFISLSPSQEQYQYDDQNGSTEYWYKTRYYSTLSDQYSTFSDPIEGDIGSVLPGSDLIDAKIYLAGPDGKPLADRIIAFRVISYPDILPTVSSYLVSGQMIVTTDETGFAQISLVKGAKIEVAISGTDIVREITVPTTGSEFSLSDAIANADDIFQIHVLDIPSAVRRTL